MNNFEAAKRLWKGSKPIGGCAGEEYLRTQGFEPPYSDVIRFHASVPYVNGKDRGVSPAMLCKVVDAKGNTQTLQTLWLSRQGNGCMDDPAGGCVRLSEPGKILGIAKDVTTALAVERKFKVPCWATITTENMHDFELSADIGQLEQLLIFSDFDENFRCQAAAYGLAATIMHYPDRPFVNVYHPHQLGTWADEWRRQMKLGVDAR